MATEERLKDRRLTWLSDNPPVDIVVRQATVDDAAQVVDVLNGVIAEGIHTLFDEPFSEGDERRFIASLSGRSALFVADGAAGIVGLQSIDLFMAHGRSTSHVGTMGTWLRGDVRRQGIGRLLAAQSFAFARAHDYSKIVIHVLAANEPALRFYRGLGFEEIGVARKHVRLGGQFHDEVYLEMHL